MTDDADRWNGIYKKGIDAKQSPVDLIELSEPAHVLRTSTHLLPASGKALDLACGLGANSVLMAQQGLSVDAYDIADVALKELDYIAATNNLPITTFTIDLNETTLPVDHYNVILVSRYLDRALFPQIIDSLSMGGLLMYQTFTQVRVPGSGGPSNPRFLLAPGELLRAFAELKAVAYRDEGLIGQVDSGWRNESYLVAVKS